jgi:hypothetical protein
MKYSRRKARRPRSSRFNQKEFSFSTAKTFLGRLLEKARRGEEVTIVRGSDRISLSEIKPMEPIPMRPPGYFQLDEEDLALERKFSRANVPPRKEDFE